MSKTKEVSEINIAVTVYTIVDDIIKALGHKFDKRQKMTDSEVITTEIIAALIFGGNIERARKILLELGLIPDMLGKSRLNRRIHKLADLAQSIFCGLGQVFKQANDSFEYIIDSFPVAFCENVRISRCRLAKGEQFRGRIASKARYFYGVKVQVITTSGGIPVEFSFIPGRHHDSRAFDSLDFDLPGGSTLIGDSAYGSYDTEDLFDDACDIRLDPQRKKVSQRQDALPEKLYKTYVRKRIETVFSQITQLFPKKIHAVTLKGFLNKVFNFILAFTIQKAFCL